MAQQIQKPASNFEAEAIVGGCLKRVSLEDYEGKYVVLVFLPFGPNTVDVEELSENLIEFRKRDCEILVFHHNPKFSHLTKSARSHVIEDFKDIQVPLIDDTDGEIFRTYGVLDEVSELPIYGYFIMDSNHIVKHVHVSVLSLCPVEDLLHFVQDLQISTGYYAGVTDAKSSEDVIVLMDKSSIKSTESFFEKMSGKSGENVSCVSWEDLESHSGSSTTNTGSQDKKGSAEPCEDEET